jgi:hypothetical protein
MVGWFMLLHGNRDNQGERPSTSNISLQSNIQYASGNKYGPIS